MRWLWLWVILLMAGQVVAQNPYITPFYITIDVGQTAMLNTKLPAGTTVYWKSTNPQTVEITESSPSHAKIKGLKSGSTAVTYRTDTGRRASAMVYVGSARNVNQAKRLLSPERVIISPQKQLVPVKESIDFFAKKGRDKQFQWSVGDSRILKLISSSGGRAQVKAIAPGTTHVFAKASDGTIGDALITVMVSGRQRHSIGIKYFEPGPLQGWKPYARTGGVTVYKG